ncbi:MAG: uncharacterized protein PWQ37_1821 [Candidatus Petromonas sp.]|jgi:uncharacterized protein (DUF2225 family)|nr:uncharacterized protein [Candidatus Petromonas sp.]
MNNELYEKTVHCPVCDRDFTTQKVRTSAIRVENRDEDFCPYYKSQNPLFYSVFVCPHCGYAALEGDFSRIGEREKEKIKETISPKWRPRSYDGERTIEDALEVYKLALLCSQVIGASESTIGKICLRLAWLHRYLGDEKEKDFIKFAVKAFHKAYTTERLDEDQNDMVIILYLLGELNRRVGNYKDAIKWFDKALREPSIKKKRHIELKAREQWSFTREEYRKQKSESVDN